MKVSVNWLKDYVDLEGLAINELSNGLSLAGLEVEGIEATQKVEGVVTAKVLAKEKHPNADKLNVCSVTDGSETFSVVCGAPNVETGQTVAFAKIGAKLPGINIKAAKIRGVESFGMICSEMELGVTSEHSGILVLPENTPLNQDINGFLGLGDTILELNVTPNRPDWLGIIGVARETAAVFGRKFTPPEKRLLETKDKTKDKISVKSENTEKCPIYATRIIKGVKLGPSPLWMQARLRSAGIRPINNVVDITNYIMLEWNQPLHAFDLRCVDTGIIVRNAYEGEKITALNGKEYDLNTDTLLIADYKKPLGIAGIMGGEYTSISDDTQTVLLECAYFTPIGIRKTSKRLGLSSEASYRYERGIDYGKTLFIADYAAALMSEICGGEVLGGIAGGQFATMPKNTVISEAGKINALLGTNITAKEMGGYLNCLEIDTKIEKDKLISNIPTFRGDITRPQDIAEEVARLYGYDKIETTIPVICSDAELWSPNIKYTRLTRERLESLGFSETVNFPFMSPDYLRIFDKRDDFVKLLNPISADMAWLRSYVFPGVIKNLQTNLNQGENHVRLFEISTAFISKGTDKLADETGKLCLVSTGDFLDVSWVKYPKIDAFYYIKSVLDNVIGCMGLKTEYIPLTELHFLHPGKSASVIVEGVNLGFLGAFHPEVLEVLDMKTECYAAEIDFSKLCSIAAANKIKYAKFSRFPFIERDFAVVTDENVRIGEILSSVRESSPLVAEAFLFDVFTGDPIGEGKKSLAFRVRFSDLEKTLSDEDIKPLSDKILKRLEDLYGAKLR